MSTEVKLSSKGQIVIPSLVRKKMNLKPGDKVKIEAIPGRKAIIQPATEPPREIFVSAGEETPTRLLAQSRREDEAKLKRLLKSLGAEP
jgi:AbrB family looped-hinge helix DNA binding protein